MIGIRPPDEVSFTIKDYSKELKRVEFILDIKPLEYIIQKDDQTEEEVLSCFIYRLKEIIEECAYKSQVKIMYDLEDFDSDAIIFDESSLYTSIEQITKNGNWYLYTINPIFNDRHPLRSSIKVCRHQDLRVLWYMSERLSEG